MRITPRFGRLSLTEGAAMLQGLYEVDLQQLREGVPGILGALTVGSGGPGRRMLRYIRSDKPEHWRTVREVWEHGGGDCEDLAAAVAAELTLNGEPARPVVYQVSPRLAHVVVRTADGRLLDPSKLGGMRESRAGGVR